MEWYRQGETEIPGDKPVAAPLLATRNVIRAQLGSSPDPRGEMPSKDRLTQGTAPLKTNVNVHKVSSCSSCLALYSVLC